MSVEEKRFEEEVAGEAQEAGGEIVTGKSKMMTAAFGLSALMTVAGCGAGNACEDTTALKTRIAQLEDKRAMEGTSTSNAMEVAQSGIYSYGTVGAQWLSSAGYNHFDVNSNFSGPLTHYFVFWPPIFRKEELKFTGKGDIDKKLEIIPLGEHWAVLYKSQLDDKLKEVFAIDANGERFVIGFERKRE
jgi:hypothetical protein